MAAQQHTIGKVALDLTLGKEEGHFPVQQRWADILKDRLVPALSEIFDRQVPVDQVWWVDKLTIDLGLIHEKMSDREIAEKLIQQIKQSFENYRVAANGHLEKIPMEVAELDAMVFFLRNGYLPAGALDLDVVKVFTENVANNFKGLTNAMERQIGGSGSIVRQVAQRIAWQFPEKGLLKFLEKYIRENSREGLGWLILFYEKIAIVNGRPATRLKELFWFVFFKIFFDKTLIQQGFGEGFFQEYFIEIIKVKGGSAFLKTASDTLPKEIQGLLEKIFLEKEKIVAVGKIQSEKKAEEGEEELEGDAEVETIETVEGIFCKNAGVVLLHPFLMRFFDSFSLLAEDRKTFQDKGKAEEAVHWLHYLATGMDDAPEQDLALAKFLCGLKIAAPVRRGRAFSKEEKEEAEAMLEAAIDHWKVLKNTSPDGLRDGFLQRQGRLTNKQNGSLLEMENKAQDILLGQLPWGMSVVRFPWMEAPLWVQWG